MSAATESGRRAPRLSPAQRAEQARRLIEQRGLRIEPFGVGWRVYGPGVDLLTASFDWVGPLDLEPRS
ncbi:MAG: hypothetical protein LC121_17740 [Anaerolineae bacterium]|nr:hypothetical protein [Anaerolineae bacterium]